MNRIPLDELLAKYGFKEMKIKEDVYEYRRHPDAENYLKIDGYMAFVSIDDPDRRIRKLNMDVYESVMRFIWYHELTKDDKKILKKDYGVLDNILEVLDAPLNSCIRKDYAAIFEKYDAIEKEAMMVKKDENFE